MIDAKISAYARFILNPYKTTKKNGTQPRKIPRYDVAAQAGYWEGWKACTSPTGQLYLTLVPNDRNPSYKHEPTTPTLNVQAHPKGMSLNLTGLRFAPDSTTVASGEPSADAKLKNGKDNPLYQWRNDGFLFLFSEDKATLEVIVITGGRAFIDAYRQQLAAGGFSDWLAEVRKTATLKV